VDAVGGLSLWGDAGVSNRAFCASGGLGALVSPAGSVGSGRLPLATLAPKDPTTFEKVDETFA